MPQKNVLVFIHGITMDDAKTVTDDDPGPQYKAFYDAVCACKQGEDLAAKFPEENQVQIKWGAPRKGNKPQRDDEFLSDAEDFTQAAAAGPALATKPGFLVADDGSWKDSLVQAIGRKARPQLLPYGLADAVYYVSDPGERAVRQVVYEQLLKQINPHLRAGEPFVLHFVGHSLGVTIAHDIIYNIFGKPMAGTPFSDATGATQKGLKALVKLARAKVPQITMGTFCAMASQLPVLIHRSNVLERRFAKGQGLKAEDLGLGWQKETGPHLRPGPQVRFFFDSADILGYPSRLLYDDYEPYMQDVQVNNEEKGMGRFYDIGFRHTGYWVNEKVHELTAEMWAEHGGERFQGGT